MGKRQIIITISMENGVLTDSLSYEPFDPAYLQDMTAHLKTLRENDPVYRSQAGYWVVTRYDDVNHIQRSPDLFSVSTVGEQLLGVGKDLDPSLPIDELNEGIPVTLQEFMSAPVVTGADDPKHAQLRRVVNRGFLPTRIKRWDNQIEALMRECLEGVSPKKPWDVVSKLAVPLPVWTMGTLLGVRKEDGQRLKHWSDVVFGAASGPQRGTREATMSTLNVMRQVSLFFGPLVEERRLHSQDDLISDLVRAEEEETLTEAETLMFILLLMVAGAETTTNLIGNTIVSLMENRDQLELLHANPSLIPNAIEESLRYRSPGQLNIRSPFKDTKLGGKIIPAGEQICLMIGAANRDPKHFANPEKFDITRDTKRHLAFGHGIHLCLGSHLARRETAIVLSALLDDLPKWKLDGEPLQRVGNNTVYGYKRVGLVPC